MRTLVLEGARAMGIPMTQAQAEQFERYHALLLEANARMNLTRVPDDPREAVDRNYLDCIAPLADGFPEVERAVDVGSGAGFPGIPLSIMLPDTHFTLIDSLGKRVEFLQSVVDALGLNARALHLRAEDAARRPELRERFDLATARAVAPMNVLCEYLLPFVRVGGRALALKGPGADEELACAKGALALLGGAVERVSTLRIPGRDWDHRAVWLSKAAPTPDAYPRRAGVPEKKPLVK
ncbi:MAG: 16S rRNA (guanine(527)-N(7))-methyltransferase RsmG [Clostridia bacterium]|nr:16S rRNA (guanine(527)-N(7))-methyltransferase RsmG [Clostridia bacterium]